MRIFIAEKHTVAKGIADVLGGAGKSYRYIKCGSLATRVTWCFGHLLGEAQPERSTCRARGFGPRTCR